MKNILLSLIVILAGSSLQAQNLAFEKLYCSTENNFAIKDFILMPTGSVYIVGYDTINFATIQGSAIIRKLDKDFNLIWERKYGGSGGENFNLIQYLGDCRLLVRGGTNSLDGDVLNNFPFGTSEWVCIMDTNGNILHQLIYTGAGSTTQSKNIRVGPNGDIYFCGWAYDSGYDFTDNGPFDFANDGYIACADSQLNKKWLKFFEVSAAGNSSVEDVNFLPNGHLLLSCTSTVKDGAFAVATPTSKGATIVMEMDTLFNIYWQKRYGAANPFNVDGTMGVIYKDKNNWQYYLLGATSTKDGDCWDAYPYLAKGDHDYHWIMKIDTSGNKIWSHIYGGFSDNGLDGIEDFREVFFDNIIHYADGAMGSDMYAFGTQIGKKDTWIFDIDSNGTMIKHDRIGYTNVSWRPDLARLNPITKEIYYLYNEEIDTSIGFETPSPNICDITPKLWNNIIGKYNYWPNTISETENEKLEIIVFPNPARNEIYIEKLKNGTLIEIFTIDGKKIVSKKAFGPMQTISVAGWRRGIYLITANYKKQSYSQKVVLQ